MMNKRGNLLVGICLLILSTVAYVAARGDSIKCYSCSFIKDSEKYNKESCLNGDDKLFAIEVDIVNGHDVCYVTRILDGDDNTNGIFRYGDEDSDTLEDVKNIVIGDTWLETEKCDENLCNGKSTITVSVIFITMALLLSLKI